MSHFVMNPSAPFFRGTHFLAKRTCHSGSCADGTGLVEKVAKGQIVGVDGLLQGAKTGVLDSIRSPPVTC
jgi:hypothetical protein